MKYILLLSLCFFTFPAFSQFVHRNTLIGTGSVGLAIAIPLHQGASVSISGDGNIAVVGSAADSSSKGGAWVYIRNGNQWVQAGKKLVANDYVGNARFGFTTAISYDGSTIAIGGYQDNNSFGATWIFVRTGNTWVQQGPKLIGTQTIGSNIQQGKAIALSTDGNTLLIGAWNDNASRGAVWIFVRNGTTWSQQGNKITDSPNNGWLFGASIALSADGNTALIGAPFLNNGTGFIYKRTGTTWSFVQKLTDVTSTTYERIGESVALSANGDVAVLGGPFSNQDHGLVWVFRRNPTTQLWAKEQILTPTGTIPFSRTGSRLTISRGGDTLATSGYNDANNTGAVWMFIHSGGTWSQLGTKITSPISGGFDPSFGHGISLSGDGKILLIGRPGGGQQGAAFVFSDPSVLSAKPELNPELRLYPNPVRDVLHLPRNISFSRVTVSDLRGSMLVNQSSPVGQQLDLSHLPVGVYIVSLQQQDKVQYVRVVKE